MRVRKGVQDHASECVTYVFERVCMRCSGSMLDVGTRQSWLVPGVMATYRGRPSVWYSAALWGLIAVTSSGTPCTLLSQGLHQVASQLCENNDEMIRHLVSLFFAAIVSHRSGFRTYMVVVTASQNDHNFKSRSADTTVSVI